MKQFLSALVICSCLCLQAQQNSNNFKYLDINRVKTAITPKNQVNYDSTLGHASYEVPQGSGRHTVSGSAIWFGGIDNGGQLRQIGQTYRQNGTDCWPGPLDLTNSSAIPGEANNYNKVWKVSYADINNFIINHVATSDMITWPGSGNVALNEDAMLAPFIDVNSDGHYNINDGDYPAIKGDQAVFAIFNDNTGNHASTGLSTGLEIHLMAYAYGCPQSLAGHNELAYTTFYEYTIINRNSYTTNQTYMSLWSDLNIGDPTDDYVGCDVKRHLAYAYNGSNFDVGSPINAGYGAYPPAQGILVLQGPYADAGDGIDNDGDGCVDCTFSVTPSGTATISEAALPEHIKMSNFNYYTAGSPVQMNAPQNATEYYGYMDSHWKDWTPLSCGGNGYGGSIPSHYAFPDNSDTTGPCGVSWNELSAGNTPGDRNAVIGLGAFTCKPGSVNKLEFAYITSFDSTQANNPLASLAKLKLDADKVQAFYNMPYKPNCYQGGVAMGVQENSISSLISVYPNPAKDLLTIDLPVEGKLKFEITDVIGKIVITGENEHTGKFAVPVSNLTPGVYFIRLSTNGQSAVKKFIKE